MTHRSGLVVAGLGGALLLGRAAVGAPGSGVAPSASVAGPLARVAVVVPSASVVGPLASAAVVPSASVAGLLASAAAASGSANAPAAVVSGVSPRSAGSSPTLCRELLPAGKERPRLVEGFPQRGLSGHAAVLRVDVEHGVGETVLPDGFHPEHAGDKLAVLEGAGFILPDADGGAGPRIERTVEAGRATTRVEIPLVPLPPKPGRHELTLPALPIAIARASGDVMTLCTAPHTITVEDPTASADAPPPRPNPPPRRQLEEWTALKYAAIATAIALPIGLVLGWLAVRWWKRPRVLPPPPPPRPPWEVALEALDEIRHSGLVETARFVEHFDQVSYVLRRYVGDRFGFDGLENTTYETLAFLRKVTPPVGPLGEIERFLRHADLVKFAKLEPSGTECEAALGAAERIVVATRPSPSPSDPDPAKARKETRPRRSGGGERRGRDRKAAERKSARPSGERTGSRNQGRSR
ncbi:MAG: hypothetical protein JW751_11880 [Polyangiaceae bacterium]|nr:hypothetical protein [Polyangiaceae bacterium]